MRGGQNAVNFLGQGKRHLLRPGGEQQIRDLICEIAGAEESRQGGEHDEEWKHRHQHGECDVAGDGPAVVGEEVPVSIDGDGEGAAHFW